LEAGAGSGICYSDAAYSDAGARIVDKHEQVLACDLIFKIAPPTMEEINAMRKRATVFSMLQLPDIHIDAVKAMVNKQINAVGYELMSPDGSTFPVRNSISEIEGAAAISVASELLSNEKGGKGILLGGVPGVSPTEVVIIGAGMAGTVAARAALALGACVKIFDNHIDKLRKIQNELKNPVFTSVFQPNVLINAFESADVVIGAMCYINDPIRYIISEDVIKAMKAGALLIDLRISQGGCFETTGFLPRNHPTIFEKHDVLHYCVPNLSSQVARTASMALSNIFIPLIERISEQGGVTGITTRDMGFRSGLYIYAGKLVNNYVAKYFNLPASDISLFLTAF
jgi:alanine dehydrogenase